MNIKKIIYFFSITLILCGLLSSTVIVLAQNVSDNNNTVQTDGRIWAFNFIVPANVTTLNINFADWLSDSSGIHPGSNIQFYSTESTNAPDQDNIVTINNSTKYSGVLNLIPVKDGDQEVHVVVQAFQLDENSNIGKVTPTANYTDTNGNIVTIKTSDSVTDFTDNTSDATTATVTSITLNETTKTLMVGYTDQLIATIFPADTTNKNVIWTSDDPTVATVDNTGNVTAISPGFAMITAMTTDGSYKAMDVLTVSSDQTVTPTPNGIMPSATP